MHGNAVSSCRDVYIIKQSQAGKPCLFGQRLFWGVAAVHGLCLMGNVLQRLRASCNYHTAIARGGVFQNHATYGMFKQVQANLASPYAAEEVPLKGAQIAQQPYLETGQV